MSYLFKIPLIYFFLILYIKHRNEKNKTKKKTNQLVNSLESTKNKSIEMYQPPALRNNKKRNEYTFQTN